MKLLCLLTILPLAVFAGNGLTGGGGSISGFGNGGNGLGSIKFYYNGTVKDGINFNGTTNFFAENAPGTPFTRTYPVSSNNQYFSGIIVTNVTAFQGPVIVTKYIQATNNGTGNQNIIFNLQYEVYTSTNNGASYINEYDGGSFPVLSLNGVSLPYVATIPVPYTYIGPNGSIIVFTKISQVQNITSITFSGGSNSPASLSFTQY